MLYLVEKGVVKVLLETFAVPAQMGFVL